MENRPPYRAVPQSDRRNKSGARMIFAEQDMWSLSVSAWAAAVAFVIVRRITGGAQW